MHRDYTELLDIARQQSAAVARGDLDHAVALLQRRGEIIDGAPAPDPADAEAIREVLDLDRTLSSAIREEMISIGNEGLEGQRGQTALAGYRPRLQQSAVAIDASR
jgi:hypothetical protein